MSLLSWSPEVLMNHVAWLETDFINHQVPGEQYREYIASLITLLKVDMLKTGDKESQKNVKNYKIAHETCLKVQRLLISIEASVANIIKKTDPQKEYASQRKEIKDSWKEVQFLLGKLRQLPLHEKAA